MKLSDLLARGANKIWTVGDKIPWHEPDFSSRMLREHLTQTHDGASRRIETVERHVAWIHEELLEARPSRVLDVGCGPGLYTSRLASLGHHCTGIDIAPASIEYAREIAQRGFLACEYQQRDATEGDLGADFELAMMLFGELNAFRRDTAAALLSEMHRALGVGGQIVAEFGSLAHHKREGLAPPRWHTAESGLFSREPHLCLRETDWNEADRAAGQRDWVVDIASGEVTLFSQTLQAYTDDEIRELVAGAGFTALRAYGSVAGEPHTSDCEMTVIVARKK